MNEFFAIVLVAMSLGFYVIADEAPRNPHRLLAVFPPWWTLSAQLNALGQSKAIGKPTRISFISAATSREADLAARLRSAGAMFVLDGALSRFCGDSHD